MTVLPVVARELRIAARKRSNFWVRVAAALAAMILGSWFMAFSTVRGVGAATLGGVLFGVLTWLALAAALSAGLFFTSDCLSEEKREGTLGFLFLTDLRGYDVAGGKLLASSLRGFFALLAVLPVLAVTLLMGGVTGAQFWKTSLALVNALFFSLSAGLLVSALSRDAQKALGATLLMLLLWTFGGPVTDAIVAGVKKRAFNPALSLSSPAYAVCTAGDWGRSLYWRGLGMSHALGWVWFGLASFLVPRLWQERAKAKVGGRRSEVGCAGTTWGYCWKYGGAARRARLRRKLIDRHPVLWLACRERWQSLGVWAVAILAAGGFAVLVMKLPAEAWMVWSLAGGFLMLVLYLWAASQACRFFVEARRSGLTELLLASPVNEKQIVQGQWRALVRMFALPMLLLVGVEMVGAGFAQASFQRIAAQIPTPTLSAAGSVTNSAPRRVVVVTSTVSGTSAASGTSSVGSSLASTFLAPAAAALTTIGNLIALSWFGMWMGLTSRNVPLATLQTFAFVQVIPWFVLKFAASMMIWAVMMPWLFKSGFAQAPGWFAWWPLLTAALAALLSVGKDIGFFVWSRKRLYLAFRDAAARNAGGERSESGGRKSEASRPPTSDLRLSQRLRSFPTSHPVRKTNGLHDYRTTGLGDSDS